MKQYHACFVWAVGNQPECRSFDTEQELKDFYAKHVNPDADGDRDIYRFDCFYGERVTFEETTRVIDWKINLE